MTIRRWIGCSLVLIAIVALGFGLRLGVRFDITGDWEGIYFLAGPGKMFTVTDDLFPEDTDYLITGFALTWFSNSVSTVKSDSMSGSNLVVRWDDKQGRGYIKNSFADGRKLLINLSRFKNEEGILTSGVFVGGGLPTSDPDFRAKDKDETGMSYFDGNRWYHIWCSVNEAVLPASGSNNPIYPQQWSFLGSRVLENSPNNISIVSHHWFAIDGVPLFVEKYLFYEAGNSYFTLITRVKNVGVKPVAFYYLYGDEPWLGHFGSAKGNVGWLKDGLVKTETEIDTRTNSYAGLVDYGNDLAGESRRFTGKANFIEWDNSSRPDMAYFSNVAGRFDQSKGGKSPLNNDTCRFLGLEWGPRPLMPAQSFSFTLAIGMANNDMATGFPVKPVTPLN